MNNEELLTAIEDLKLSHYVSVYNSSFTCPAIKRKNGVCNCEVKFHNEKIDAILKAVQKLIREKPMQQP